LEFVVHLLRHCLQDQSQQVWLCWVEVRRLIYFHFWCRCGRIQDCECAQVLQRLICKDLRASGLAIVYWVSTVWLRNRKDPFKLLPWELRNNQNLERISERNPKLLGNICMHLWCLDEGELAGVFPTLFWSDGSSKCIHVEDESTSGFYDWNARKI